MNPSILLVDVASPGRESWKAFLEDQECDVFTAESAESARQMCLRLLPDLVLLHDHLPGVRASDLCKRLKMDPVNRFTPMVLISSAPTASEIQLVRGTGTVDFWGTPASVRDGFCSIPFLLRFKGYVEERAKSLMVSFARSIEAKHSLMNGHSARTSYFAVRLGESLGLNEKDLEELRLGCLLHDIGKVGVPDQIILKRGRLSPHETELVRQHTVIGEQICAPLKSLRAILPMIRHHHERMDGSGYPDGLGDEEIPLKARIIQVADVYDALTNDRPYREAVSHEEALRILHQEAMYGWLDSSLVWKFSGICRSGEYHAVRGRSMLASYYT